MAVYDVNLDGSEIQALWVQCEIANTRRVSTVFQLSDYMDVFKTNDC